jgi:hypothetical protein
MLAANWRDYPVLWSRQTKSSFVSEDLADSSYFTFVSGDYIITIRPTAICIEFVPVLMLIVIPNIWKWLGNRHSPRTPIPTMMSIYSVRKRSRDESPAFIP